MSDDNDNDTGEAIVMLSSVAIITIGFALIVSYVSGSIALGAGVSLFSCGAVFLFGFFLKYKKG